ncbi:unnamed protein product, partial [Allacma fusca]
MSMRKFPILPVTTKEMESKKGGEPPNLPSKGDGQDNLAFQADFGA